MIVAGIDPGFTGALAVVNEHGHCESVAVPTMGEGKQRLIDGGAAARWLGDRDVELAVIELAQAMPRQGSSSGFRYGLAFGQIIGVVQTILVPYQLETPARWKRGLGLKGGREQKDLSRRKAIELFPKAAAQFERKKDEARAEAALIAWWWLHCRRGA